METRRVARGHALFKEGDPADRVFRLRSGTVEIVRHVAGQTVIMGMVGPDQFVGEMAALERRIHHSATAQAAADAEVEVLTPEEFLDRLDHTPGMARALVERLSQRLYAANERILHDQGHEEVAARQAEAPTRTIRIAASSPWLQRQMPEPIAVGRFPFVVGRRTVSGEPRARQRPDLLLDDHEPFRLSRDHFMLVGQGDHCFIRDMASTLGTLVNGEPVGENFRQDEAPLRDGENEIVAGGRGSRFVFTITVG